MLVRADTYHGKLNHSYVGIGRHLELKLYLTLPAEGQRTKDDFQDVAKYLHTLQNTPWTSAESSLGYD